MLGDFFREKDSAAVVAFVGDLAVALFEGVPEPANGKEVPAKTKVSCGMFPALTAACVMMLVYPSPYFLHISRDSLTKEQCKCLREK